MPRNPREATSEEEIQIQHYEESINSVAEIPIEEEINQFEEEISSWLEKKPININILLEWYITKPGVPVRVFNYYKNNTNKYYYNTELKLWKLRPSLKIQTK